MKLQQLDQVEMGERIRKYREMLNLTREQLAEQVEDVYKRQVKISSFAKASPTALGTRIVPPAPGKMPKVTSGKPILALSPAILMSQVMANSIPPPRA